MNYDTAFLQSNGIASEQAHIVPDREARAILWQKAIPFIVVYDVLLIVLLCKRRASSFDSRPAATTLLEARCSS